ncbi:hypothetical protein KVT40_000757 [Elsinoe batatas]|uniref:BRCT domain-containing protein n=1 Tax=Elsinoe batatas TaxID=2601811 RepID=A0A8K0L9W9_9PEZI|nr:hypothetical protein KVT40_000757 [Elsinoe batatas]
MTQEQVYIVLRTDFLDREDEGHLNLISVHNTPNAAKKAMEKHIVDHNGFNDIVDPNTNRLDLGNSLFGAQVIVGAEDYHSYEVKVVAEIVHEMEGDADDDAVDVEEEDVEEKPKKKANGTKKAAATKSKAKPKKAPAKRKTTSDEEEDGQDEEAMPAPPSGSSSALQGLKFIVTGTLEGLKRTEAQALIENHGGQYVRALPKTEGGARPDYVVLGVKPGDKKVEEIRASGYTTINQADLYELIETRTSGAKKVKR